MNKTSNNFPKDSCPISEVRRNLATAYLTVKGDLEAKELWAEAFEKVAEKTFQVPYWRSFLNASLPSSDAKEISDIIGIFYFSNKSIYGRGYGYKFSIQTPFIVPQLARSSTFMVMAKTQFDALCTDTAAEVQKEFFYMFLNSVYSSSDTYMPWLDSTAREQIPAKMKEAHKQFEEQYHNNVKTPAVLVFPFKDCGLFIIDDEEFNKEIASIQGILDESKKLYNDFIEDTRGLPLYGTLWKKPRGEEWRKLLYTTHGMMKLANKHKANATSVIKSTIFSEKQLEKALVFLKSQYNPNWKSLLASPHDGLWEPSIPTFWKRTKLFAEYLTWTDLLWERLINGQAYKDRLQLTENFPGMSQFGYCVFLSNAGLSGYYSAAINFSCKIPYKFPRPVLLTSYSEKRNYNLVQSPESSCYLSENVYRFPIGTTGWGPEDEIIAGPSENFNDPLISSILKNCEKLESKYKQAIHTVCHAYKTVDSTGQTDIKEQILSSLSEYELSEFKLSRGEFASLY